MPIRIRPTIDKSRIADFWARGRRTGTCLIWTMGKTGAGYGRICIEGVCYDAHVLAYLLTYGELHENVLHTCDTPACYEPTHLFEGTQAENIADCIAKGRFNAAGNLPHPSGAAHPEAVLTLDQVLEIRAARGKITQRELAYTYAVSQATICRLQTGLRWKHDIASIDAKYRKET